MPDDQRTTSTRFRVLCSVFVTLAVVAAGAALTGCGGSDSTSATDQIESGVTQAEGH